MNIYAAVQRREARGLPFRREFQRNLSWVQRYECSSILRGHQGCVNAIQWSKDGRLLCSGSDDRCVMLWHFQGCKDQGNIKISSKSSLSTLHRHNIFDAQFTSDFEEVVSCGADGCVCVTSIESPTPTSRLLFEPESGHFLASKIAFAPHAGPRSFLATFGDGRVRLFDLREACHHVVISTGGVGLTGIELRPTNCMTLAVGANDPFLRLYDLRALKLTSEATSRASTSRFTPVLSLHTTEKLISKDAGRRGFGWGSGKDVGISGLSWSADGQQLLANYRSADVMLFDMGELPGSEDTRHHSVATLPEVRKDFSLPTEEIHLGLIRSYEGRVNVQTCAKEVRYLCGGAAVGSGGDCGNFFIWETSSGQLLRKLPADRCVVNCVAPHPHLPLVCTSGIDAEIKAWDVGDDRVAWSESRKRSVTEDSSSAAPALAAHWGRRRREGAVNTTPAEASERLKAAEKRKQRGNAFVKQAGWTQALDQYQEALKELHFLAPNGRIEEDRQALAVGCWLNCSFCHLSLEEYALAVEMCSKVLEKDNSNIKAYFRRASALGEMREFERAFEDIEAALNIEQSNSDICKLRTRLQKKQRQREKRERNAYQKLFATSKPSSSEATGDCQVPEVISEAQD